MEYDVDVDVHATVRVKAESEDDAMDVAEVYVESGVIGIEIHSVYPTSVCEAQ